MIVCVCNALREDAVRVLAEEGLSFEEIQSITGCSGNCGSCREYAEALVESSRLRPRPQASLPILGIA
jgi:bacterioferritin-associated ferredoxin